MNMNMVNRRIIRGRQRGFTLVELLVAMAIAGALMVGIVQVFISSKSTYRVVENLSRIQENGRFAMDSIAFDVRMAGYRGCRSTSTTDFTNSLDGGENNALYDFETGIQGFDAVNSSFSDGYLRPALDYAISKAKNDENMTIELIPANSGPHDEPDVVISRAVFGSPVRLDPKEDDNSGEESAQKVIVPVDVVERACPDGSYSRGGLCPSDIVMISDCNKARVFQITRLDKNQNGPVNLSHGANGDPGNKSPVKWGGFRPGSEIVKVGTRIYFIANFVEDRTGERIPSLFVLDEYGRAEMLATHVEDMQIYYGVDTDPSEYMLRSDSQGRRKTATDIENDSRLDWNHVVNAEIRVLMRSEDSLLTSDGPQPYAFDLPTHNNQLLTPADNNDTRLRREFANTVTVRNRALF